MGDNQERRATVRRVQLGDGDLPAFEVTSPCCGKPSLITAWMINAARANTAGRLLIECGRHTTDPLRPVRAAKDGCGRRYVVRVDQDVPVVEGPS